MTGSLMIQGTTSDAGKSILVAGLCRVFARKNIKVAPFKPQNMALNSAVTVDGGEIGRAQAVQAFACGIEPHTDMNPVLLKPNSDVGAQVIIHGKVATEMDAQSYHQYKTTAMQAVLESYERLKQQYDIIFVEGAGSPAEINLRDRDIANMGFAEKVDCPVALVGDIDRGGVFAQIVGTLALLSQSEQQRIATTIINKFRGDLALLHNGISWLEQNTQKPVAGVLPYLHGLHIEAEDALVPESGIKLGNSNELKKLTVVVPVLPRISNHTDFDILRLHPQVDFQYVGPRQSIPATDLIILPGSKNVRADYQWLKNNGWEDAIQRHLRYSGKVIGICGGFQMLGNKICDPHGIEGSPGDSDAMGLLDMITTLQNQKQLHRVSGELQIANEPVSGYEIHMGSTTGPALDNPALKLTGGFDGAISGDNQILGTYVHGLFDSTQACNALLQWAGLTEVQNIDYDDFRQTNMDRLADAMEEHLNMSLFEKILNL